MPIRRSALALLAVAALAATGVAARDTIPGYLAPGAFDVLAVLPPAPTKGDARDKADRRIFKRTRAMIGTPRYAMATADVDYAPGALMRDFSCAVGVALTPQTAPLTARLVERAAADTGAQSGAAKKYYRRARPFLVDHGRICQPESELADSYDYPSGHTTYGWTWAETLTDLVPERATPILARGRAYGQSRFVCGAHNYSAVEAGYLSAGATMAAVRRTPGYQAEAAAARTELRRLIADPATPRPTGCDAEARLVAQPLP